MKIFRKLSSWLFGGKSKVKEVVDSDKLSKSKKIFKHSLALNPATLEIKNSNKKITKIENYVRKLKALPTVALQRPSQITNHWEMAPPLTI